MAATSTWSKAPSARPSASPFRTGRSNSTPTQRPGEGVSMTREIAAACGLICFGIAAATPAGAQSQISPSSFAPTDPPELPDLSQHQRQPAAVQGQADFGQRRLPLRLYARNGDTPRRRHLPPAGVRRRLRPHGSGIGRVPLGRAFCRTCQEGHEAYSYAAFRPLACGISLAERQAPVAQLDRALDYESRGREFESLRARHLICEHGGCLFWAKMAFSSRSLFPLVRQ